MCFLSPDKYGQRAFVGKVNMNQNSPEYYIETAEESQSETERYVKDKTGKLTLTEFYVYNLNENWQ